MAASRAPVVGLVRGQGRYNNVYQALQQAAGKVDLSHARRILVKPNFVSVRRQLSSTHVDAVRAVLDFLRERGVGHVVIGEWSGSGTAMDAYRNFGYLPLLDEYDAELVDLGVEEWVDTTICNSGLAPMPARLSRRVVESDLRVSVTPIKTHNAVIATLSLKNMALGALRERQLFHQGWPAMHLTLYALAPQVAPHLSVIDGYEGMEGDSPLDGDPVLLDAAIASTDFLAADTIGALLMEHDPQQIGYLVYGHRGGLGEGDPACVELRGNATWREAARRFRPHPTYADQVCWHTPAADQMILSGSRGVVRWPPRSAMPAQAAAAGAAAGDRGGAVPSPALDEVRNALIPATAEIPAGSFLMGEPGTDDGQHEIELPAFRMALHPVTNQEYARFLADGGYTERWASCWTAAGRRYLQDYGLVEPAGWAERGRSRPDHPVVGVSLYEALAYCAWLSRVSGRHFTLPTEAQWEKGARGVDGRCYPWGSDWAAGCCNTASAGVAGTTPVLSHPTGRSPYGLFDMAGNVWEWCSSAPDAYPYRGDDAREDPNRISVRALRGGSWFNEDRLARCAFRTGFTEGFRGDHLGFRLAEAGV